jgi:poly(3-hydroxybutyrate) depolymerase
LFLLIYWSDLAYLLKEGSALDAYLLYDTSHAVLQPWRVVAEATRLVFSSPFNPLAYTLYGRSVAAACELFERTTRRYVKPAFGVTVAAGGEPIPVSERVVWSRPFCRVVLPRDCF